tara:strand:+ start:23433 stop:24737 length:1305 start_codon:yes stop_codon:yes gene_type:complete
MIVCAGLGGILYGYDIGVYSGALPFIRDQLHLSTHQVGFIGGAMFGGSLVGTLITGYLSDQFGRRKMIIAASALFMIAVLAIVNSTTFSGLLISRIILGIGIGVVQVAVPTYLSEVAPTSVRGLSVTMFQLFLTIGIVSAYLIDYGFTAIGDWQAMFAVIAIPASVLLISMIILPESPRWLFSKLRTEEAIAVLHRTHSPEEAKLELSEIVASIDAKHGRWRDLFTSKLALPLFIAFFIAIFNQLTAINGFLQYAPIVFRSAGFTSNTGAMMGTVGLGAINFIGTVLAMILVDRVGRRRLIIIGTAGIVVSYAFLAITSHMHLSQHVAGITSLVGLLAFVVMYAVGPGVVVWLAMQEFFPTEVRAKGLALCLFANSLTAWVITTSFLWIKDGLGLSGTYWLFGICTLAYCVVSAKFLPETKQRSLEEVQMDLNG